MKKNTLSLMAVLGLAMTIASCSSDLVEEKTNTTEKQQMVFTATQEDSQVTRTSLNDSKVEWKSNDAVAVWDGSNINAFTATPGSDATTASLTGSVTKGSSSYVAVYPYSVGKDCDFNYLTKNNAIYDIVIPETQTATIGSFDPDAAIMIAAGDGSNLAFHNLCSFLKIETSEEYKKIVVSVNSGYLAGKGGCENYATAPDWGVSGDANGKSEVTLQPKSGSTTIAKGTYYITVAPGTIKGLTVDCYTSANECVRKSISSSFTFERSKSYNLGSTGTWKKRANAYSVSATKQVMFTTGNLYWDNTEGSQAYHIESSQIGSSRDAAGNAIIDNTHVSYFYWTNLDDYNNGYKPYASQYSYKSQTINDKFWCSEDNKITVDGISNLYVLTFDEWLYLIKSRDNASKLYKKGVTVKDGDKEYTNCLIIAPDNYDFTTSPLGTSYTLADINAKGLTCLPAVGDTHDKNGSKEYLVVGGVSQYNWGCYWSSTPSGDYDDNAYDFYFNESDISSTGYSIEYRKYAHSMRLVYTYE